MPPEFLEQASHLAQLTVDRAGEAVFWTDLEGHLLYANKAATRSLGYSASELQALKIFDISPEFSDALWKELWKEIRQQGTFTFEFSLRAKEKRVFPVEMDVHHLPVGGQDYAVAFFHDIQERKRLQHLKDEFVSTVSHELRTPMTIIREGVSQVLEGLRGTITPEQHRALTIAITGIDRLGRIINELLDVSKIESGKLQLKRERVDMVGLVREVCGTFATTAADRDLEIHLRIPGTMLEVYVDRDRLVQVFTNLLSNALKFTEKGHVTISLERRNGILECGVADTGVGIPKEELGKVFNKFEQLGRTAVTGEKGTGLGLSICKGIVELHKGKIWAESEAGKGARFVFTLPGDTARDAFREQIAGLLREALLSGATLSTIVFDLKDPAKEPVPPSALASVIDGMEQLIQTCSGRKSDILIRDARTVYLGLPSTVRKEALRVVERVAKAFQELLAREGQAHRMTLSYQLTSFPEDTPHEVEFLKKAFPDS